MKTNKQYQDAMRSASIGWVGIIITIIIMLLMTCQPAQAQKVYITRYSSQADLLVWQTTYPSSADIKYYVVDYPSQVNESKNHWYFVKYPSQADIKIFYVRYPSFADKIIMPVKYPSQTL